MGTLAPAAWQAPITEHTPRATIVARLLWINGEAMALSRRGRAGMGEEYVTKHAALDVLLCWWEMANE